MKCENCGNPLTGTENFCRLCGTPVNKEKKDTVNKDSNIELTDNIDVTKIVVDKEDEQIIEKERNLETKLNTNETDDDFLLIEDKTSEQKIKNILEEFTKEDSSTKSEEADNNNNNNEKEDNNSKKDKESKKNSKKSKETIEPVSSEKKTDNNEIVKAEISDSNIKEAKEESIIEQDANNIENNASNNNIADIISLQENNSLNELNMVVLSTEESPNKSQLITNPSPVDEEINKSNIGVDDNNSNELVASIENNKKHRPVLSIILVIIIIILCIPLCFLTINYCMTAENIKNVENENDQLKAQIEETKNNNTDEPSLDSIVYNGYEIPINPTDKIIINNSFVRLNDMIFAIGNGIKYNELKTNLENLKITLAKNKYNINNYGKKVSNSKEYIFFDAVKEGEEKTLIIYTGISEFDSIVFVIPYSSAQPDFSKIESYFNFVSSLKKTDSLAFTENSLFN